jgi:multidrug efflux pump subunit AcrA (membrane-fusion protein)
MDIARTPARRPTRWLLLGGGGVLLVAATVAVAALDPAVPALDRAAVMIDTVRRGDVVREVRAPGTLVPERIRFITAQASARVERVLSESGRDVAGNAVLLELSNPDLQIQTLQAEQQARQAEVDLLSLRTSLRGQLLTQEGTVATTRTLYVSAMQESAAADSLVQRQLISVFDANNRRAQAEELTTRLRVERDRLALLRSAVDSQLDAQAARVRQLRAIAASQQARLASLVVRAPEAGVLQELTLQLGQWVPEGTTLAKVVQPDRLKAVLRVPESQAKDVRLGLPAEIDTRNGVVRGRVVRKDPSAQGGAVLVDVALEGPLPQGAVPDLSIDGTVRIETLRDVLHTGRPVATVGTGAVTLFRVEPDGATAVRVSVELGRSSVNTVEVIRGLEAGDRVIVSDMTAYATTPRVRIR